MIGVCNDVKLSVVQNNTKILVDKTTSKLSEGGHYNRLAQYQEVKSYRSPVELLEELRHPTARRQ